MGTELIVTMATGIVSMFAGILAQWFARRLQREKQLEREQVEKIAEVVKLDESARRVSLVEAVVNKLPEKPDLSGQILQTVEEIALRVSRVEGASKQSPAVEGLVRNYHEQALSQAQTQFWFSVVAATVGFGWILYAGLEIRADNYLAVLKTLPGIVMDVVAFLFFKQASETRQRATELYDRLRKDKQMTEAIGLVGTIQDPIVKSTVQAQIALKMAGLEPEPVDLNKFLVGGGTAAAVIGQPNPSGHSSS